MADVRDTLQQTLGDAYRIERELGGGGMSRVFVAQDVTLGRDVVIKILAPELAAGVDADRFQRETQLAARLQHSYIVPLLSAGVAGGRPYYTMPFVEGESLRERIERTGELPMRDAVKILRDVAEALAYAHEHGVVHRDIKPANVLLTRDHAFVTDFGIAKAVGAAQVATHGEITSAGFAVGTPAYMAPEQAVGDPSTDHRADIYAFGVVAYEMLAGQPPFTHRSDRAVAAAHAVERPRPLQELRPAVPAELAALVTRCLEKRPADRPQSARELVDALDRIAATSSDGTARVTSTASPRRRYAAAAAAVLLVAAGIAIYAGDLNRGEPAEVKLAVLPFENLGAAADAFLADGIAEEIGNKLAGVPGLIVIGRSSGAHLKRAGSSPREIGARLNADYVLDGSVRWAREGTGENVVRVIPQLIRVSNSAQVWSEPYQGPFAQVLSLQTDIAEKVTQAVRLRLLPSARTALRRPTTTSVAAYENYLLGRHLWKQRGPALERAAERFSAAIRHDPTFAPAYSGLADSYILFQVNAITSISREEAYARAKAAALKAVQLDSTLAESWASLGLILVQEDVRGAYDAYRRAMALDPTYATGQQWYGELLAHIGRYEEAIEVGRHAIEMDPFIAVAHMVLAHPLAALGRYDEAEATLQRALEIDPSFIAPRLIIARTYLEHGKTDLARASLVTAGVAPEDAAALTRRPRDERERERALRAVESRALRTDFYRAVIVAWLGEQELALDYLERSAQNREQYILPIRGVRMFAPLRAHPRFVRVLDAVGLSDRKLREAGLPR